MTSTTAGPSRSSPWIAGPARDLGLFVLTPVLILAAAFLLRSGVASKDIQYAVIAFGAMGHNLPGMLRAYGDRALFRRFRIRFIVAPVALFAVCFVFTWRGLTGIALIAFFWAVWHALMQVYGFLRIYGARAGATERRIANLDFAMCLAWFAGGVLWSDTRLHQVQSLAVTYGIGPLDASAVHVVRLVIASIIAVVTALFLFEQFARRRRGQPISAIKNLLHASSIAFWWYAHVLTTDVLLGIYLFEIFHDVQYLAIVWYFNLRRVDSDPAIGGFTRQVFRRSYGLAALYVGLCFAYGGFIPLTGHLQMSPLTAALAASFVQASALLHYYFDGFIWKVRERSTRAALGMDSTLGRVEPIDTRHAAKWALLAVPAAVLWCVPARTAAEAEIDPIPARALAESTPLALRAQLALATASGRSQDIPTAVLALERARSIAPDDQEIAENLAAARVRSGVDALRKGSIDEARRTLAEVAAQFPALADVCNGEGLEHLQRRELDDAIACFRASLLIVADRPAAHLNLALALRERGMREEALEHARRGAAMLPQDDQARALVQELEKR